MSLLLALALILLVTKVSAFALKLFRQPPVIGEVLGGIILGPTVFGKFFPVTHGHIFPKTSSSSLDALAQVGIVLFMFVIGIEFDTRKLKNKVGSAFVIANASMIVPLLLGGGMGYLLFDHFAPAGVTMPIFALFCGISVSVTAFPVLARIIKDLGIQNSPMAVLTMVCAALGDVAAWCLLALMTCIAGKDLTQAGEILGLSLIFVAVMIFAVQPVLRKMNAKVSEQGLTPELFAVVIGFLLLSALATEAIGIHALFGAFLLGVLIPSENLMAKSLLMKLELLTTTLFLPVFFAYSGMKTDFSLIAHGEGLGLTLLITIVAIIGKVLSSTVSARMTGIDKRDALALGFLMNTRGLVELVVLNLGLELGLLSPTLFSAFVVMTLITTLMTTPLFNYVTRPKPWFLKESSKLQPQENQSAAF